MITVDTKTDKQIIVTNGLHKFELRISPETINKLATCKKAVVEADTSAKSNFAQSLRSELFATIFGF